MLKQPAWELLGRPRHPDGNRRPSSPTDPQAGSHGRDPGDVLAAHPTDDQRAVEAMLAGAREPCTVHQLALGLAWPLTRTVTALQALDRSLANTGQALTRTGQQTYVLGPRPELLREVGRCLRHTREPLGLAAALVLHRVLTCPREGCALDSFSDPAERAAIRRLITARLLEDDRGFLRATHMTEATFRIPPKRRDFR